MKHKIKAIIAIVLVVCIVVGILIIALKPNVQTIDEYVNSENIIKIGTTDNDVSNKEYTLMLENEQLQFWLNKDTTEFKVVNKSNNFQWYSTNQNRADASVSAAPLTISYMNSQGGLDDIDVMTGSVVDGKYIVEQTDNKVVVRYSVGDFSELVLIPYALTESRFEEIKNSLEDEFQQYKLQDLYYLTDINIIEDKDLKEKRLKEYPALKRQKLYIIRDGIKDDPLSKKDIAKIFAEAGYTDVDYEQDSKYFTPETEAKKAPGFNIRVEYVLTKDGLNVKIPYEGIEMHNEFPMTSITFAPNFGSPDLEDEGWFLLPDGSGSLMNFYNEKSLQIYRTTVYGLDSTQMSNENLSSDLGAALPVFGIQNGGYGVLCEIAEGDAISQIVAYAGDSSTNAYAHAVFNVRSTYKQTTSTGKKDSYIIIQKKRYTGDISLNYHFINSTDTQLSDMADIVRTSIFGDANSSITEATPVMLEQVGMITRQNQFLGFAYDEKVALTEFEDSLEITEAFTNSAIENLSVIFTGWFSEGVDHSFLSKQVSSAKILGGDSALKDLLSKMQQKKIPFYLDVDIQFTAKNGIFDGFSKNSMTATMLDQSTGKLSKYNLANFMRNSTGFKFINNLSAQMEALDTFVSTTEKYSTKDISLRMVGSQLFADYGNPTVDRQAMANAISDKLKNLKAAGYNTTTQGANAYALPYINNALNVPVTSSGFDTTDMAVPFIQMVLSGNVNYYAPSVNLSGDVKTALLQAVSTGSGFYCVLTAQNSDKLAGSAQDNLYSTDFNYWKNTLPKTIADYQKRLEDVAGKKIVGYEKIAEGVYKTSYNNGVDVIVNYNSHSFVYEDISIAPKDFGVKGANV